MNWRQPSALKIIVFHHRDLKIIVGKMLDGDAPACAGGMHSEAVVVVIIAMLCTGRLCLASTNHWQ